MSDPTPSKSGSKKFQAKTSGKKVKNKKSNDGKERHNRKAFCFSGGSKSLQRKVQYSADKSSNKQHAPILDKTPSVAPPYIVVIQGPPGCGKSTLIRSLVKHYCKQNIGSSSSGTTVSVTESQSEAYGPITFVASRHRRVTLFEVPKNDVGSMIDLCKIADLALVVIDASVGFEMDTFEFINLLQVHGMPKIMGVLTHLDKFPETKVIRKKKKEFKARFWAECYGGAKLFYFSGLQYGRYPKTEVANLARYIAVQNAPVLSFRQQHPYVLGLRWEDQTLDIDNNSLNNTNSLNRKLHLYGYLYGARLRPGQFVHVCGMGDFPISSVEQYPDPCPSPILVDWERQQAQGRLEQQMKLATGSNGSNAKNHKLGQCTVNNLRTLQERHRSIFAPGCLNLGSNMLMDKDAVYVNLPKHKIGFTRKDGESKEDGDHRDGSDSEEEGDGIESGSDSDNDSENGSDNDSDDEEDESKIPESVRLVRELQDLRHDRRIAPGTSDSGIANTSKDPNQNLKSSSSKNESTKFLEDTDSESDNEAVKYKDNELKEGEDSDDEEDSDENDEDDDKESHKKQFMQEAAKRFQHQPTLQELIYGSRNRNTALTTIQAQDQLNQNFNLDFSHNSNQLSSSTTKTSKAKLPKGKLSLFDDSEDEDGEGFGISKSIKSNSNGSTAEVQEIDINALETWRVPTLPNEGLYYYDPKMKEMIKKQFISGCWGSDELGKLDQNNNSNNLKKIQKSNVNNGSDSDNSGSDDDSEEDAAMKKIRDRKKALDAVIGEPDSDKEGNDDESDDDEKNKSNSNRTKDDGNANNSSTDLTTFDRHYTQDGLILEDGIEKSAIPIGAYIRIVLENIPKISVDSLDIQRKPLVIGGLLPGELKMAQLQLRVKAHRWSPSQLKSHDPVLCSMGWRRYQTLPMYSLEDRNEKRMRFLKYTPEHMHCYATFTGPTVPPNTGCIFIKNFGRIANYRISATGNVLESSASTFNIVKKLKLVGTPYKVFKNTCFINGMFNSDLEVNKALHAKLQTVSGIRGEIKKSEGTEGHFRATFEDRLKATDIVMLKSWINVEPKSFYNPMLDLKDNLWRRLKSAGELRFEQGLDAQFFKEHSEKSGYGAQIIRNPKKFEKLKLPARLESELPFATKNKNESALKFNSKTASADNLVQKKGESDKDFERRKASRAINQAVTANITYTDRDHEENSLLNRLQATKNEKERKNRERKAAKQFEKQRLEAKIQEKRDAHTRENRKRGHVKSGKEEDKKRKRMRLDE